jgi:hypothetical protein
MLWCIYLDQFFLANSASHNTMDTSLRSMIKIDEVFLGIYSLMMGAEQMSEMMDFGYKLAQLVTQ